jgi:hypothetical protein
MKKYAALIITLLMTTYLYNDYSNSLKTNPSTISLQSKITKKLGQTTRESSLGSDNNAPKRLSNESSKAPIDTKLVKTQKTSQRAKFVPMPSREEILAHSKKSYQFRMKFNNVVRKTLKDNGLYQEYLEIKKSWEKQTSGASEELAAKLERSGGDVSDPSFFVNVNKRQKEIFEEHRQELQKVFGSVLFKRYLSALKSYNETYADPEGSTKKFKLYPINF